MVEDRSFPADARARNTFAVLLAGLAGCADSIGFLQFGQLFMSFMSGNTTRFGVSVANTDWPTALRLSSVIALFCFGAFLGTLVAAWAGRWRLPVLLGAESVLLGLNLILPLGSYDLPVRAYPIVLALGMQNATLQDDAGRSLALTYVTGAVVRFGTGLANLLLQRSAASFWTQAPLWGALTFGAVLGAMLQKRIGLEAFLCPAALAAGLATFTAFVAFLRPQSSIVLGSALAPDAAGTAPSRARHATPDRQAAHRGR